MLCVVDLVYVANLYFGIALSQHRVTDMGGGGGGGIGWRDEFLCKSTVLYKLNSLSVS